MNMLDNAHFLLVCSIYKTYRSDFYFRHFIKKEEVHVLFCPLERPFPITGKDRISDCYIYSATIKYPVGCRDARGIKSDTSVDVKQQRGQRV
jgi:hypothetical protein